MGKAIMFLEVDITAGKCILKLTILYLIETVYRRKYVIEIGIILLMHFVMFFQKIERLA